MVSTVRKLTESDKHEILKLYRETAETTSTLADRYGVSNSTISRLLKSTLPEDEYEYLVSLKRAARTPEGRAQVDYENLPVFSTEPEKEQTQQPADPPVPEPSVVEVQPPQEEPVVVEEPQPVGVDEPIPAIRRVKRRTSSAPITKPIPRRIERVEQPVAEQLELLEQKPPEKPPEITSIPSPLLEDRRPEANVIAEMFGEDLLDESDDLEDLEDDLDDDEEEYSDEDDFEPARPFVTRPRSGESLVRVLPLSAASLPKTCYLVIDRSSELITRPLREFGDLGQIPNLETQQRTLPVFDNHRVAKRFSTKRDRVIKVPDSKMLHKARYHLQAKGITRLLIDGQVYSLSSSSV
ncbi:transposase [Tolypothrix campylonemoides VB511288]|nr:transposase [Tolypothrix campylonemoides VB511288]